MPSHEQRGDGIAQAVRDVAAGAEPQEAAENLLRALVLGDGGLGSGAALYFLNLREARFSLFASFGERPRASSLSLESVGVRPTNLTPAGPPPPTGQNIYRFTIVRKKTAIGVLDIITQGGDRSSLANSAPLDILSAVFVWLYEQAFASRLLGGIQKPIPYDRNQDWFLEEILSVIRESSGMAYAAVRERTSPEVLRCLAVRGFADEWSGEGLRDMLTFEGVADKYPAFAKAMESGEVVTELDMSHPRNQFLRDHPALKDVQSYVVAPINVGSDVFGTLSLATKVRYPFTSFERQGFKSIANGVGIAITNFRNHHDMVDRFGDIAVGVSALEISTSVRHATGNILERAGHYLGQVKQEVPKPSERATHAMGELETELQLLAGELQKFKVATERPARELEGVALKERWEFAVDALGGRMKNLGVVPHHEGSEVEIIGFKDWIGHLFLNLVLNSLDAFEGMRKKGGREVRLRVQRPDNAGNVTVFYSDTATGIVGQKLVGGATFVSELPVKQKIFEPHVTSKRDPEAGYLPQPGAGLGLFLVRKIMDDHSGSIDLMESRDGVRFRLVFPQLLLEDR
jgi:Histidine kinase-, DNA gyrase B-, and HSP90-like ATPase/GAF domain